MTPGAWLSLAAVCLLGAMSPGPSLALVLHHTLVHSRRHGMAAGVLHGVGVGIYAGLTVLGLGALYRHTPALRDAVSITGAFYLLYLAARAWRAGGRASALPPEPAPAGAGSAWRAARDGFAMAFLNPKIAIFFLALFSQFIGPGMGAVPKALMAVLAAGIDASWYSLVALGLSRTGAFAALRRHAGTVERASALLLTAVALWVLADVLV